MGELLKWGAGGMQAAHQERMDEIASQNVQADTEGKLIANQQAEVDAGIKEKAAAIMRQIASGKTSSEPDGEDPSNPTSMSDAFAQTGQKLMELGFPEAGMDYMKNAGVLRKDEADGQKAVVDQRKSRADLLIKQADIVGSQLGTAGDDDELWEQGLANMEQSGAFTEDQMATFRTIPRSAVTAEVLATQSLTAKDKASLDLQAQGREIQETDSNFRKFNAERLYNLAVQRQKDAVRLREQGITTGAAATAPSETEVKFVSSVVLTEIFSGTNPSSSLAKDALKAGAVTIAARAKDMVRQDRSLDWSTAVSRAVMESKTLGDWEGIVTVTKFAGIPVDKSESSSKVFKPKGTSPEKALPFPATKRALVKGRYYNTKHGPARWTGSAFTTE